MWCTKTITIYFKYLITSTNFSTNMRSEGVRAQGLNNSNTGIFDIKIATVIYPIRSIFLAAQQINAIRHMISQPRHKIELYCKLMRLGVPNRIVVVETVIF